VTYADYKVDVPEGESGPWKIEKFTISKDESKMDALRGMIGGSGRYVRPGTHTRLTRGSAVIMSDTHDEIRDHLGFIREAHGRVLIQGLGLGMCALACLKKEEVTHLTIIDNSPDVIKLTGPWLQGKAEELGKTVEIIEADALEWKPPKGETWDVAWFDIWDDLSTDNLKEMATLHRRFGKRAKWKGSWGKEFLQYRKRQEEKEADTLEQEMEERLGWRGSL